MKSLPVFLAVVFLLLVGCDSGRNFSTQEKLTSITIERLVEMRTNPTARVGCTNYSYSFNGEERVITVECPCYLQDSEFNEDFAERGYASMAEIHSKGFDIRLLPGAEYRVYISDPKKGEFMF